MKKVWKCRKIDKDNVSRIAKETGESLIVTAIALNRFEESYEKSGRKFDLKEILQPNIKKLKSPFELPDMGKAVDRILDALDNEEKVLVYGDYDADGITATTILRSFLEEQGIEVAYYIPNRIKEGYGIKKNILKEFKDLGYSLVITVDTGITAVDEVRYANEIGLDIIITDHHEMQEELPDAIAVVDLKRKDIEIDGFKDIAGCFVAYKVIEALAIELGISEEEYTKYIPLATIGTIADVMPLVDENRVLVTEGIRRIKEICSNDNLKAGCYTLLSKKNVDNAQDIAFKVVPALNASGRLGEETGIELLNEKVPEVSEELLKSLELLNEKRKQLVLDYTKEIIEELENNKVGRPNTPILVFGKYNEGVVGIIAAKLVEKYSRPAIVLAETEEGIYKGSGRSKNHDIFSIVDKHKEKLLAFGGHKNAIGLSVTKENVNEIKSLVESEELEEVVEIIEYDMVMNFNQMKIELIEMILKLEPFGEKNPYPEFMFKNLKIKEKKEYDKVDRYVLSQEIEQKEIQLVGVSFDKEKGNELEKGDNIYIIARAKINEFAGKKSVNLEIIDMQKV